MFEATGVRVNAVCPMAVDTHMMRSIREKGRQMEKGNKAILTDSP